MSSTVAAISGFLPLEGGVNFRDIGGYHTHNGRMVRRGRVFRTGVLCYLTEADSLRLKSLGVRRIFDLRRTNERTQEPTRWPDAAVISHTWDDGPEPPSAMRFAKANEMSPHGMREAMLALYEALPDWMAPRLRDFFKVLREEHTPTVIHCAAGKDRTGIAVALLLHALGVRHEDILRDYLLTNEVGNLEQFMTVRKAIQLGVGNAKHPLSEMDVERRRVLLVADPDYLDAALRHIDRNHGGIDSYLERALQITPAAREQLQQALLI